MRGAPQVGFSAAIRKIRARTSLLTHFRPATCLALETHVQYKRNPARCQLTTVLGSDQDERLCPPGPERSQRDPEQLVQGSQSTPRSFWRAELAIAGGVPGFRGRGPPGNGER